MSGDDHTRAAAEARRRRLREAGWREVSRLFDDVPQSDSGRTEVVSVRDALPGTYVYVGRAMPGRFEESPWANPFRVRRGATEDERRVCLAKYRAHLLSRPDLLARLPELRGRRLGCWCGNWAPGQPELLCHAVLLAKMADGEV